MELTALLRNRRLSAGVVAVVAALAVGCSSSESGSPAEPGTNTSADRPATSSGAQDPGTDPATRTDPTDGTPTNSDPGSIALPADPLAGDFDVDACAVLVAAAGEQAVADALGDPILTRDSLMGNCSMTTKEYTINSAGSTSTGRLSFGISPTSLAATGSGDPVAGLTDSKQNKNAVVWHRGPYWFSLQVLPVQKSASDPDVIDPAVLTALAKAVNAKA